MKFKKCRSIRLSYERQGLIFFTCRTYRDQPPAVQRKILRLCQQASRENPYALYLMLVTGQSPCRLAQDFHLAENTLYQARKRFYESWGDDR